MNCALLVMALLLQSDTVIGEITKVERDEDVVRIRVNLGRDSGLKPGHSLTIFSPREIISVPGTGNEALAREREIGAASVVEVMDDEVVAQVTVAREAIMAGGRVSPGKAVERPPLAPHIREQVVLDPKTPRWGSVTRVKVDVEDLDGDLALIECRASDGLILNPVSGTGEFHWLPPVQAMKANLTVRAVDRGGRMHERTLVVDGGGVPSTRRPSRFTAASVMEPSFIKAADLSSDKEGNLYVLDSELRRILKWGPAGRREWISDAYGHDMEFKRLVVDGKEALLLDSLRRRVIRYPLRRDMFEAGPVAQYGGDRRRPGSLRKPVDIVVSPEGTVWVLDEVEGTIKMYSKDGTYQATAGDFGKPISMRQDLKDRVYVLDAGRLEIVIFEGLKQVEKQSLPEDAQGVPIPVDFQPGMLLYGNRLGRQEFSSAAGLRRDLFGRVYVIAEGGSVIFRMDKAGKKITGRRGGVSISNAEVVRAAKGGGFHLEDGYTRWTFDVQGWLIETGEASPSNRNERDAMGNVYSYVDGRVRCNGASLDINGVWIADFDVDTYGSVLLLESDSGRVVRLAVSAWQ